MIRTESRMLRALSGGLVALLSAAGGIQSVSAGTSVPGGTPMAFSDQTASCGVMVQHIPAGPLLFSVFNVAPMVGGGAVADFNNDGFQDIFFVAGGGTADRLFINNGNGTFSDQAVAWGVGTPHMGIGASAADYNKDGWTDLFITSVGPPSQNPAIGHHKLYRNNGNGTFTNVAAAAGVATASTLPDGFGSTWGDYDLDGDLDLLVAGWVAGSDGNRLYRNNGDGTFTNVTVAANFQASNVRGFSPALVDMNGDRYPEILLAADFGTSQYYVNNRDGTFTKTTTSSGVGLDGNGMGSAIGDVNGDGLLDWYVTSIHSYYTADPGIPGTGNMLYINQGNHLYSEGSTGYGVKDGGWGWGTVIADMNNDGLEDIVETNGWPFSNGLGVLEWISEPSYLWRNNGDNTFTEQHAAAGFVHTLQGRALMRLDMDNDGDQDIAPVAYFEPFRLYRNDCAADGQSHWLRVFLNTSANPRLPAHGLGSVIRATDNAVTQVKSMNGMCHYLSTSELSVHIGLGTSTTLDELRIEWSSGIVTVLNNVAADQTLTINAPKPGDANSSGLVGLDDIAIVIQHWDQQTWQGDVTGDGFVNLADIALMLMNWND